MNDAQDRPARRKRSGSEQRKTLPPFPLRLLPEERAAIEAAADRAGLTMGSYIRSWLPEASQTGARRRPPIAVLALVKLQSELNKIGGNIYQLLRHVNFGRLVESDEIRVAFTGYREATAAILALRRQYESPPLPGEAEVEPELEPDL